MNQASIAATLVLAAVCWPAGPASAQEASTITEAGPSASIVTIAPNQTSQEHWLEVDLKEASERSRRTRNALISTSFTFAIGAILAGIGASQCEQINSSSAQTHNDLMCNRAGDVLLPLGGTIAGLSFVGMLTPRHHFSARNRTRTCTP